MTCIKLKIESFHSGQREVSADERHQLCDKFDEILRPLGLETSHVVIRRAN